MIDGLDPEGTKRRIELTRYACQPLALSALTNGLRSALEEIGKRSRQLQEKGKARDPGEVVKLVEKLQEAIAHYQVSGDFSLRRVQLTPNYRHRNSKPYTTKLLASL